ncbi:SUN domain-containing protein 2-like isoform X2 [Ambystoma mexicanum]|uniref:SUN domain-containing protein 2-like isoform X2 n=1 Tax=Ambystoma mexicanum TaxID=8296 RepID=UPI0037E9B470
MRSHMPGRDDTRVRLQACVQLPLRCLWSGGGGRFKGTGSPLGVKGLLPVSRPYPSGAHLAGVRNEDSQGMDVHQRQLPYSSSSSSRSWERERELALPRPRPKWIGNCRLLAFLVPLDVLSDCGEQVIVWAGHLQTTLDHMMPITLRLIREHWMAITLVLLLLQAALMYMIVAGAHSSAKEQERMTILLLQRECKKWSLEQDLQRRVQESTNFPASILTMMLTSQGERNDEQASEDHALYKAGARVVLSLSSAAYVAHLSWSEWLLHFLRGLHEADAHHRRMQEQEMVPGSCFPMEGQKGVVTLKLNTSVAVSSVGLDHLPRSLSHNVTVAPRDFTVYCFDEAFTWARKLGSFRYEIDNDPSQTFRVQREPPRPCRMIRLWVLNNWGNKEKTCIYRFRVHGRASK